MKTKEKEILDFKTELRLIREKADTCNPVKRFLLRSAAFLAEKLYEILS